MIFSVVEAHFFRGLGCSNHGSYRGITREREIVSTLKELEATQNFFEVKERVFFMVR